MFYSRFIVLFFAASLLAGCTSNFGPQAANDFTVFMDLEKGVTTKRNVYEQFGQPHEVYWLDDNHSIWAYYRIDSRMNALSFVPLAGPLIGGQDADVTSVFFRFDENIRFVDVERQERAAYKNNIGMLGDLASSKGQAEWVEEEMALLDIPFDRRAAKLNARRADAYAD